LRNERLPIRWSSNGKQALAREIREQIEVILEAGPRKEQLLKLHCEDINFETAMGRYHGKGGKTRSVLMNERAREIPKRRVKALKLRVSVPASKA
jgi:site-specific recombinase XerD